ncbi:hypothetical protein IJS77_01935 [bacterium]|nr:hypothetical protein [bacterium]
MSVKFSSSLNFQGLNQNVRISQPNISSTNLSNRQKQDKKINLPPVNIYSNPALNSYKTPKLYPLGKLENGERIIDSDCVMESSRPINPNYLRPNQEMVENNTITNGEINNFIQGGQRGDCYLLASLYALKTSEKGKDYIKNCVKYNDDGSVTVTLPGALKVKENADEDDPSRNYVTGVYRISKEALEKADKQAGKTYAYGDRDVRIMELAFEAYRAEAMISNYVNGNVVAPDEAGNTGGGNRRDTLSAGSSFDAIYIITGKPSELYQNPQKRNTAKLYISGEYGYVGDKKFAKENMLSASKYAKKSIKEVTNTYDKDSDLQRLLDKYSGKEKDYAISVSVICGMKDRNGRIFKGGGHALTVTKITADFVEVANPHHTNRKERIPRADFEKMAYKLNIAEM